jgi:hypothetical protein
MIRQIFASYPVTLMLEVPCLGAGIELTQHLPVFRYDQLFEHFPLRESMMTC